MEERVYTSVRIGKETREVLQKLAREQDRSMGWLIRDILDKWVEQKRAIGRKGT